MIEMQVAGLGFDPRNLSPLVLLKDFEEITFLPIWIGVFEAASIAMTLQGVQPPRPMTHDLLKILLEKFEAKMQRIIINDIREGTFYALVEMANKEGKKLTVDCRPSDAIALALRTHSSIFVSETVMMQAKLVNAEKDAEETKKFKEFIENVRPEDFIRYYQKD